MHIFLKQINQLYYNKNYKLDNDDYYQLMMHYKNDIELNFPILSRKRAQDFNAIRKTKDFLPRLKFDEILETNKNSVVTKEIPITKKDLKNLNGKINENLFFVALFGYTVANYNNTKSAVIFWTYRGRNTKNSLNAIGVFFKTFILI